MKPSTKQIAIGYLERGISVIPLKQHSKQPAVKWSEYRQKSVEPVLFTEDSNLGLLTGNNGPLNLIAIDIDRTGEDIETAKAELDNAFGVFMWHEAPCQMTPSGGRHYFFQVPDGYSLNNRAGIIEGVDIRADGGYIVVAPSVAESKQTKELTPYQWQNDIPLEQAAFITSEQALDLSAKKNGEREERTSNDASDISLPVVSPTNTAYGAKALDGCINAVLSATEGVRNDTLNCQAFNVGQLIAGQQLCPDSYYNLLEAAKTIGLDEEEAKATICSGIEAGLQNPRPSDELPRTELSLKLSRDDDWGELQPFEVELEPVVSLSPEMVPPVIYRHAKIEAQKMDNAPIDFIVMSMIICASAVIGTTRTIRPKVCDDGWEITPVLWGAVVGYPSSKKSPTLKVGIKLLNKAQQVLDKQYQELVGVANVDQSLIEMERKIKKDEAQKALKDGDKELAGKIMAELNELDVKGLPQPRKVMVNDATVEAIAIRAAHTPEGVLVERDELSGLLNMMNQSDNSNDRAFYLEGFNGDSSYSQDRVSRPNIKISRLAIWLLGGIQPDKLVPYLKARHNGNDNDGFVERLQLMVFPDYEGPVYTDTFFDTAPAKAATALFKDLAELTFDEKGESQYLRFSFDAQWRWNEWAAGLYKRIEAADAGWQAILGKYHALCAKLALVFSFCLNPEANIIELEALEMAIRYTEYLESHTRRIQTFWREEDKITSAKVLLNKLDALPQPFTRKHIADKNWRGLDAQERDKALLQLEQHGYIKREEKPNPGSRPSVFFYKHPDYYQ